MLSCLPEVRSDANDRCRTDTLDDDAVGQVPHDRESPTSQSRTSQTPISNAPILDRMVVISVQIGQVDTRAMILNGQMHPTIGDFAVNGDRQIDSNARLLRIGHQLGDHQLEVDNGVGRGSLVGQPCTQGSTKTSERRLLGVCFVFQGHRCHGCSRATHYCHASTIEVAYFLESTPTMRLFRLLKRGARPAPFEHPTRRASSRLRP